ncbi:gamma-glutamylcyclotransferase 2-3 isoform X2 [Rosa rugosa]|uniref:gamma-glutamylcyclotransferase 2-3 isoform X2 n=1 Tax=Rosa rugosa TaxID=74645 RepID=UPI002B40D0AD|nr:gamma-glutamylcyclotransferase 2-3 isoform X2 [Rosa rugosa]
MVMWVFGYGSLIWKAGFNFDERVVGFIKDYRRVFYQGSTDHRGTPEFPGRTVTLEPAEGEVCWGAAYKISKKEDQEIALEHLEVREKQYDKKAYLDFFTEPTATTPALSGVMVYIASPDKKLNVNYLGPASIEDIAKMQRQTCIGSCKRSEADHFREGAHCFMRPGTNGNDDFYRPSPNRAIVHV